MLGLPVLAAATTAFGASPITDGVATVFAFGTTPIGPGQICPVLLLPLESVLLSTIVLSVLANCSEELLIWHARLASCVSVRS